MRVPGIGAPRRVLSAALDALVDQEVEICACAPIFDSDPVGPSLRIYANSAALIKSHLPPPDLLTLLQSIEHQFGRTHSQRRGQRWRSRALDLDIVLWSAGVWHSPTLTIPHREMRQRDFVLRPASAIARNWRDPVSGLTLGHLYARLSRKRKAPNPV